MRSSGGVGLREGRAETIFANPQLKAAEVKVHDGPGYVLAAVAEAVRRARDARRRIIERGSQSRLSHLSPHGGDHNSRHGRGVQHRAGLRHAVQGLRERLRALGYVHALREGPVPRIVRPSPGRPLGRRSWDSEGAAGAIVGRTSGGPIAVLPADPARRRRSRARWCNDRRRLLASPDSGRARTCGTRDRHRARDRSRPE